MSGPDGSSYCTRCGSKTNDEMVCHHCGKVLGVESQGESENCAGCGRGRRVSDGYCRHCGTPRVQLQEEKGAISDTLQRVRIFQVLKFSRPIVAIVIALIFITLVIFPMVSNPPSTPAGRLPSMVGMDYYLGAGQATYDWTFHSVRFHVGVNISAEALAGYHEMTDFREAGDVLAAKDNVPRVATPSDPHIIQLASDFQGAQADLRIDREHAIELMLSFVQSLPTVTDSSSLGREEYWRYPLETLSERQGDMLDKSLLLASLSAACGYDTVVILDAVSDWHEAHAAVGITCPGASGDYYTYHDGGSYFICETEYPGYLLGESCPRCQNAYCVKVY
jgi:hypothetical protein